ncbi:hypothetical protein HanRHA438_Chr11g0519041 [Helianthus annuus]|uniref:Uncharacterized protein n=1 Tax=Helianthus annuus TaxID=4232 RepID=A0A9K3N185_HELAN|nr:hypothetical protein HanXRQr2_Chr11g0506571 [Helianthus annuus]KAJ0502654.1 putative telomere repeat-binding protein, plant [Helianthus annuus]KAJ0518614.1 putative telomere repeat-binding protein, plant [Helianthus annuus]KAJ0686656.1 putative telomere repeat-binding protein, plant [Helianthus annuus]KAJ0690471.1 putative telomere repeat-binding protein, plant [Helianthus annuus]
MRDTLVYTARISPQQRRGEPVPQELLDRVLIAHGYWSDQQAKNQYLPPQTIANEVAFQQQADSPMTISRNITESDHEMSVDDRSGLDSRELLTVPDSNVGELAVVPMRKPKGAEVTQRRIRRPFSVFEVEALVKAVEKLGTGRYNIIITSLYETSTKKEIG